MPELRAVEVVIVGGGTTGVVVATRLAERGVDVLLLEEGPSELEVPASSDLRAWKALLGGAADHAFTVQPPHDRVVYSAGRLLGGSSGINNAWTFATIDADLRRWSAAGLRGWDTASVEPPRRRAWECIQPSPVDAPHPATLAFLAAAKANGLGTVQLGSPGMKAGSGLVPLGARGPRRRTVAAAYLRLSGDGGPSPRCLTGVHVERVLIDGVGSAVGVETSIGPILADEVIVCAGAIGSPWLLMRSGIGPSAGLEAADVSVVLDSPEVGRNLQDHPLTGVSWDGLRSGGPASSHGWEAAAFLSHAVSDEDLDLCLLFSTSREHLTEPAMLSTVEGFTIGAYLARPRSRGSLTLTGPSSAYRPRIVAPFFTDDGTDIAALGASIDIARALGSARELSEWVGTESEPGAAVQGAEAIEFLRRSTSTMFHMSGTCRMGSQGDRVVDDRLRVEGIAGLRVADASVLPEITTVPPYLTCVMIGERCADFVAEDRGVSDA